MVFKIIIEDITSFFQKSFFQKKKSKVPVTAKEALNDKVPKPQSTELPFSSSDIRSAFQKNYSSTQAHSEHLKEPPQTSESPQSFGQTPSSEQASAKELPQTSQSSESSEQPVPAQKPQSSEQTSVPVQTPQISEQVQSSQSYEPRTDSNIQESESSSYDIDEAAIKEFEAMLIANDQSDSETQEIVQQENSHVEEPRQAVEEPQSESAIVPEQSSSRNGFFSSFQEVINQENFSPEQLDGDLLHKMKSYHERMHNGKEPLLHKDAANLALKRRLEELQSLESEWEKLYSQSREVDRSMTRVEEEIDEKTQALRALLNESKQLSLASRNVPSGQEFKLANGDSVSSVAALSRALSREPWLFQRHVTPSRNDFALWLETACVLPELASKVREARSLDDLLSLLRS